MAFFLLRLVSESGQHLDWISFSWLNLSEWDLVSDRFCFFDPSVVRMRPAFRLDFIFPSLACPNQTWFRTGFVFLIFPLSECDPHLDWILFFLAWLVRIRLGFGQVMFFAPTVFQIRIVFTQKSARHHLVYRKVPGTC